MLRDYFSHHPASIPWPAGIHPARVTALRAASVSLHPNTGPGPPWTSRNTPRPKLHAHWCPCHRSQENALGLGLLFHSIQNEQNSGPVTWLREPPRTGDGPTPQPSLRGTTGRARPTRVAPGRPFPPPASVPAPLPGALSHCCGFSSFPQTGLRPFYQW